MGNLDYVEAFIAFANEKNIDRSTVMGLLEDMFRTMLIKDFGTDENFEVIVNVDKGDIQAMRTRTVVEDGKVENPHMQIALAEANAKSADFEVGDDYAEEFRLEDFGRRSIHTAKQTLRQKIRDLEKDAMYNYYKDIVGEIIVGEVYQIWKSEMMIHHNGNELAMPKNEQIPKDKFKKGDSIRAVVLRVDIQGGSPKVIVSRAAPLFLERLFELEVPEIYDGVITIKGIVREPGERAKVAVESYDDRIDPVGACVGMKGARIHGIVRELRNENIDVISYTNNMGLYIQRSLAPAKISNIELSEEQKRSTVYMKPDQVSLAIGKGGLNIKLASKLTGYEIDVYRDIKEGDEEDVDLDEFSDEIEGWVIDALKGIGCDTAKSVLELTSEEIARRTDLDDETIQNVLQILKKEFEEEGKEKESKK